MSVLFFLFGLLACSFAAQQFQCNFELRQPSMPNGFVRGTMKYDFVNKKILHTYTTTGNKELLSFNAQGGFSGTTQQYVYQWSSSCGCTIEAISNGFPVYFSSTQYLTPSSTDGKTQNTPTNAISIMQSVVLSGEFPTSATWDDGRVWTYSGCSAATFSATQAEFVPPSDCKCGKPIDIVVVLDRSSSINAKEEWTAEKKFTENLVNSFEYSPLGVNLGITNFHTTTWDGPVSLTQGNNEDSVKNGASALQCAPNSQCQIFGGTNGACCGAGTSISSGIVNGADMLATAGNTGFRKNAGKVLIVLTDGYHNKILNKDKSGNLIRDAAGKPSGVAYTAPGMSRACTENRDGSETLCKPVLLADIDWAVNYAVQKVPTVNIIAVGVGADWSQEQLLHIANNKEGNVFGTNNWDLLSTLVDDLVSVTCQQSPSNVACSTCCGFCSCGGCVAPDGCDSGNFCDVISLSGTCCTAAAKPPTTCNDASDQCKTYSCDRTANGGAGACASTVKPIKEDTACAKYECDPATGDTVYTDLCPPKCLLAEDCADTDMCTVEECATPSADPHDNYCKVTAKDCTESNKCFSYSCDPKTGCSKVAVPVPANTSCTGYHCNPATGEIVSTDLCPTIPECAIATDCNDNNLCTDETCVLDNPADPDSNKCVFTPKAANFCDEANKCYTYACVPAEGCVKTLKPLPANTNCSDYKCDPATGETVFTDLCPPQPACLVASDCDDKNACTTDDCVLDTPGVPLSAKCTWTPIDVSTCNDNNACTYDSCVPATGCVNEPLPIEDLCNDNDACTIDECDPLSTNATHPCAYKPIVCDNATDICHEMMCDVSAGCLEIAIVCPATDNCTVSGCNATDDEGCYVDSAGTCGFPVGAIAGIAAGAVAGIVIAAVIGALVVGGGTAYAFTQGAGSGLGATVSNNPIFTPGGERGYNPLNKH